MSSNVKKPWKQQPSLGWSPLHPRSMRSPWMQTKTGWKKKLINSTIYRCNVNWWSIASLSDVSVYSSAPQYTTIPIDRTPRIIILIQPSLNLEVTVMFTNPGSVCDWISPKYMIAGVLSELVFCSKFFKVFFSHANYHYWLITLGLRITRRGNREHLTKLRHEE